MKGFEIERGITIGELIEKLTEIDPSAKIRMFGNITIGTKDNIVTGPEAILSTKPIFGMPTADEPHGIPFIKGENEHPYFTGFLIYENDETDYTLILNDYYLEPGAFRQAGDMFTITAVKCMEDWDTYGDYVYLIKCGDHLIGYIVDSDDAEDSFVKGPDVTAINCFGIIRKAIDAVETGRAYSFELHTTGNIIELMNAAYAYTFMDDWSHMNVNMSGIQQATEFNVLFESVDYTDEDGVSDTANIGVVRDNNGVVRLVYIGFDGDELERIIDASMMLSVAEGGYNFNLQGFLSAKASGRISEYAQHAGLADMYYDTDTFAGAAAAAVVITEALDDECSDDSDECPRPNQDCSSCDLLGSNQCPSCAEDYDEDDD